MRVLCVCYACATRVLLRVLCVCFPSRASLRTTGAGRFGEVCGDRASAGADKTTLEEGIQLERLMFHSTFALVGLASLSLSLSSLSQSMHRCSSIFARHRPSVNRICVPCRAHFCYSLTQNDQKEGMSAFANKRAPAFTDS